MALSILNHENQLYVKAFSYALVFIKQEMAHTVRNFYAQTAPELKLEQIGRERLVPRITDEQLTDYRSRVVDAFEQNQGRGNLNDLKLIMAGLGYTFNSFEAGQTTPVGNGGYNLLVSTAGGIKCDNDGTPPNDLKCDNDGSPGKAVKCNSPTANDMVIELIQTGPITPAQDEEIRDSLDPVKRASARINSIIKIP